MSLKLALIIPDTHRPFHHAKAYRMMIYIAEKLKPEEIVVLGDYADFYSVSSHTKDPAVFGMLQDEVTDVIKGLDELDQKFSETKKVFLQGNHEYRLERYLNDKAPALYGVTDTCHLLGFNTRPNWKYVAYGPHQLHKILGSGLYARHEPLGGNARLSASKGLCNLVYGHIHRIEESHITSIDGSDFVNFSCGWLGDKRKDKVFGYVKTHFQWQLGFALVWVDPETGQFYKQIIPIFELQNKVSCVVNGVHYSL